MRYSLLFYLYFLLPFVGTAQQYATVHVDTTNLHVLPISWEFTLNDTPITRFDSVVKVPIVAGFDTLRFSGGLPILCRLRPGRHYLLRTNTCSSYEFLPLKNPKNGMLRTRITGVDSIRYHVSELYPRPVPRSGKDQYYYEPPSAMCPFFRKDLELVNSREETLASHAFHYLHGEKLTLHYNVATGDSYLTLDGYARGKRYQRKRVYYTKDNL